MMQRARRPFQARAVRPAIIITLAVSCLTWPGLAAARPLAAPVKWAPELGPVPGAITNTAPALAGVSLGEHKSSLLLFWPAPAEGTAGSRISYQTSLSLRKNTWSKPSLVA